MQNDASEMQNTGVIHGSDFCKHILVCCVSTLQV